MTAGKTALLKLTKMDEKQRLLDKLIGETGNDELKRAWLDFLNSVDKRLDEITDLIKEKRQTK